MDKILYNNCNKYLDGSTSSMFAMSWQTEHKVEVESETCLDNGSRGIGLRAGYYNDNPCSNSESLYHKIHLLLRQRSGCCQFNIAWDERHDYIGNRTKSIFDIIHTEKFTDRFKFHSEIVPPELYAEKKREREEEIDREMDRRRDDIWNNVREFAKEELGIEIHMFAKVQKGVAFVVKDPEKLFRWRMEQDY